MASNNKSFALADPKRFKPILDLHRWSPDCGVAADDSFSLDNEALLITDPKYLWDTFDPYNNPSASYAKTHGVIISGFGRGSSCPVLWGNPFLLLPLSLHLQQDFSLPEGAAEVADKVVCDSGSFIFLPLRHDMPHSLLEQVKKVLLENMAVKIRLPAGDYRVFYEQFQTPKDSQEKFYRNLVAQKQ